MGRCGRRTDGVTEDIMGTEGGSRCGAGGGARLRPAYRLMRGAVVFDLTRDGWVRVVAPVAAEFCDLGAFLADARAKGGA